MYAKLVAAVACLVCVEMTVADVFLYNLTSDPLESTNVASQPSYQSELSYFAGRVSYWSNLVHTSEYATQPTWRVLTQASVV